MLSLMYCRIFVFQFAAQEYKISDIQSYNFGCFFVWVLNLGSHLDKKAWAECLRE
jgi:hypothetical protein